MRKLKLQVQISVDGFMAGPNGEMDFLVWDWDEQLENYVTDLTNSIDTIILGRKLAEGFIPHWAAVAANPDDPQFSAGQKFTDTHKVVFTKTLEQSPWANTVLAKSGLHEEVTKLKQQDGKDIIVYGGAEFVSGLIKQGLIDEYHLFINPTAIGTGLSLFNKITQYQPLTLKKSMAFECGIVVNCYNPKVD
ncbi:MAG: deaminase [Anaerolineaceae bacterium]|nr:deaminase [Anaerolineaceae bacterium]